MADLTTLDVWQEIEKQMFAIVGMVTAKNEARTVGVVYKVEQQKLYFGSAKTEWKVRHIAQNPHVSVTIPIAKRIPFLPWIKIPSATITFAGKAKVLQPKDVPTIAERLLEGIGNVEDTRAEATIVEITPVRQFVTYGIGVSLQQMRDTEKARGRVAVQ